MNKTEYERWSAGMDTTTEWINTIEYKFCTMPDGWIAIFEAGGGEYTPKIQAADREHALSWCRLIEPVRVPVEKI